MARSARDRAGAWGARHLLAAWCLYWLALALAVVGPPVLRAWRLAHDPTRHGRATFSLKDGVFSAEIAERGGATWAASVHAVTVALWLAIPPLVLFAVWLARRPRAADRRPPADARGAAALPDAGAFGAAEVRRPAAAERER